jgi:cytochrome oxidase assembly protein ShyY1
MRRLPIIATIVVAGAVAVMIALGVWQLQRAEWKGRMLAQLDAARGLPPLDLDPLLDQRTAVQTPIAFRRAAVTCELRDVAASPRAGRNLKGATGYSYFIPCRPGAPGLAGRLQINAGWSQAPNSDLKLTSQGPISGVIGTTEGEGPVILTAARALGPLEPSAPPKVEDIPNNHLAYAFQWFFFAAVAAIIFILALRRRRLSVAQAGPKA